MSINRKQLEYAPEDEKKVFVKGLCSRIRSVRLLNNLTEAEFAMTLMISVKTLSEIENGERQPGARLLFVLEEYFGVNGIWLMTGSGQMLRDKRANKKIEVTMRLLGMLSRLSDNNRDKIVNIIKILLHKEHRHGKKRTNDGIGEQTEGR